MMIDVLVLGNVSDFLPCYGISWRKSTKLFVSCINDDRQSSLLAEWLAEHEKEIKELRFVTPHKSLKDEFITLVDNNFNTLKSRITTSRLADYLALDLTNLRGWKHISRLLPNPAHQACKYYLAVYCSQDLFEEIIFVSRLGPFHTTLSDHTCSSLLITSDNSGKPSGSKCVVSLLDKCSNSMGRRRWKSFYSHHPLLGKLDILFRQSIIQTFLKNKSLRYKIQSFVLSPMMDFDKLSFQLTNYDRLSASNQRKLVLGFANLVNSLNSFKTLGDLLKTDESLKSMPNVQTRLLDELTCIDQNTCKLSGLVQHVFSLEKLELSRHDPGTAILNPNLLQQVKILQDEVDSSLLEVEVLREEIGPKTKIVNYPTCGKIFRLPRSTPLPEDAILIRVNKSESLFTTDKMQRLTRQMEEVLEKISQTEKSFILKTLEVSATYVKQLCRAADFIGLIDFCTSVAACISFVPNLAGWIFPEISEESQCPFKIEEGKHPLLELLSSLFGGSDVVVPNDVKFERDKSQLKLITGPNMGGKSTFSRQQALIGIMAQWGCPVPAKSVRMQPFSLYWTRIGAEDNPVRGMSTFMTEAVETAFMLNLVTPEVFLPRELALFVIDELGRGTSSTDGSALARAVMMKLARMSNVYTVFATHFHELAYRSDTSAIETLCTAKLKCLETSDSRHEAISSLQEQITAGEKLSLSTFKVKPGIESDSDGILLAKLFGFPEKVILASMKIASR